jgi:tripartite-type tricarboxylate transporter receptor subunit TctC
MMRLMATRLSLAAMALAVCAIEAKAADATEFYKGKQITIVCSTAGGGAYDTYARLVAKHMGKHIPGNPTFIVQNMPGASGMKAANYIASVAPKDGTVFAATHAGVPTGPLTMPGEAQYDPTKLSWIGSATKELYVGYVFHTAPIRTFQEAREKTVTVGETSMSSFGVKPAIFSNVHFGTKFKQVLGYKDAIEGRLAMERGEIHGTFGTSYAGFRSAQPTWLKEGKAFVIIQHGVTRNPTLPDVPTLMEFAKTEAERQAITFMVGGLDHGKPYFGPPEIPADRLQILRRAFDATMKDPQFTKDLNAANLEADSPLRGEELAELVAREASTPKSVIDQLEQMVATYAKEMK